MTCLPLPSVAIAAGAGGSGRAHPALAAEPLQHPGGKEKTGRTWAGPYLPGTCKSATLLSCQDGQNALLGPQRQGDSQAQHHRHGPRREGLPRTMNEGLRASGKTLPCCKGPWSIQTVAPLSGRKVPTVRFQSVKAADSNTEHFRICHPWSRDIATSHRH